MVVILWLTAVAFAPNLRGASDCLPCHRTQVDSYARTAMAKTLGVPVQHPGGSYRHGSSGAKVVIRSEAGRMTHRAGDAEHEVPWFIGSGHAGRSYLVRIGNALFQSPVSWYSSLRRWSVSPGFESDARLEFDRPITQDCLFCHATDVRHVRNSINQYEDPPFQTEGIGCDRCHGDPREHLHRPSQANIISPARLAPRARDSVCEACHLSGEARIANPGAAFADFQPGMELEQVFSVYVVDQPGFRVVSHAEQLAASECAIRSGAKLWCGTCHDPHSEPANAVAWYRAKCVSCHEDAHLQPSGDCVSCHMTRRPVRDVAHTAFTDHRIARSPSGAVQAAAAPPSSLRPWKPVPDRLADRNVGLAYIAAGDKYSTAELFQEGFRILTTGTDLRRDDPAVLTAVGKVLLLKKRPAEAARLFKRASELEPADPRHHLNAAVSLAEAGQREAALSAALTALQLEPLLKDAYSVAAELYRRSGDHDKASELHNRYVRAMRPAPRRQKSMQFPR